LTNDWWGTKETSPISASQARVSGGMPWQETAVTLAHLKVEVALVATCVRTA